jgi:hypothetical protein
MYSYLYCMYIDKLCASCIVQGMLRCMVVVCHDICVRESVDGSEVDQVWFQSLLLTPTDTEL